MAFFIREIESLSTSTLQVPVGVTANRSPVAAIGNMRFNTTTNYLEFFAGGQWNNIWSPFNPIQATGGTLSATTIGSRQYNIHTFTSTAGANFQVTNLGTGGQEIEVYMWGGGGSGGSQGGSGQPGGTGGGGGFAYAKFSPAVTTYTVYAGGGGQVGVLGCSCGGAGGAGGASGYAAGGQGSPAGSACCSGSGGGGG
ncbi:MAG: hypothetical protein EBU90_12795, partial [Proteobacteria bacterium]|nr:hypothetical protein [Pseudomonadota bacterium]